MGKLELIIGPVCCGKTEELLRRVKRHEISGNKVLIVKPEIDTRSENVKSRNGIERLGYAIHEGMDIYTTLDKDFNSECRVIAIDEGQFVTGLYAVVYDLLLKGFKVIISALDSDFHGNPFESITSLLALSEDVTKLKAICMSCKNDRAIFSQKLRRGGDLVEIGGLELYEPRCLDCFVPGGLYSKE